MGRKKIGKNRLDKYYYLAKERGYRARSAFKLIQLNQKFHFLNNCETLVDLCAAPGGWLQVANEYNIKKIVGIDLTPIKAISGVETFACDITTQVCRDKLSNMLDLQADVFLHDGAPNLGVSWELDAFTQNELVVHSVKLASQFLKEGGVFVTKVFRSGEYFNLLSLFRKLFEVVEVTKPLSSREESAEIFVYCSGFHNDESVSFDLDNVFTSYLNEDIKYNAVRDLKITELLNSSAPLEDLNESARIVIDVPELQSIIDQEMRCLFEDLKIIGKSEIRAILKMRSKILKMIENDDLKIVGVEKAVAIAKEETAMDTINQKITRIESAIKKKEKKLRKERLRETDMELMEETSKRIETKNRKRKDERVSRRKLEDNDNCAEDYESSEEKPKSDQGENDYSCSDSLEMDEEELRLAIKLKENEEEFIMDSINRYVCNEYDNVPAFIREEEKEFENVHIKAPIMSKKEAEALNRRKKKAGRIFNKEYKDKLEDDNQPETNTRRNMMRKSFRRTKGKRRLIFAEGQTSTKKGTGRILRLDKRMKKDIHNSKKR